MVSYSNRTSLLLVDSATTIAGKTYMSWKGHSTLSYGRAIKNGLRREMKMLVLYRKICAVVMVTCILPCLIIASCNAAENQKTAPTIGGMPVCINTEVNTLAIGVQLDWSDLWYRQKIKNPEWNKMHDMFQEWSNEALQAVTRSEYRLSVYKTSEIPNMQNDNPYLISVYVKFRGKDEWTSPLAYDTGIVHVSGKRRDECWNMNPTYNPLPKLSAFIVYDDPEQAESDFKSNLEPLLARMVKDLVCARSDTNTLPVCLEKCSEKRMPAEPTPVGCYK